MAFPTHGALPAHAGTPPPMAAPPKAMLGQSPLMAVLAHLAGHMPAQHAGLPGGGGGMPPGGMRPQMAPPMAPGAAY